MTNFWKITCCFWIISGIFSSYISAIAYSNASNQKIIHTVTTSTSQAVTPAPTVSPTGTASPSPTLAECNHEILMSPNPLKLRKGKRNKVKVTLTNSEGCLSEHPSSAIVFATINNGKKRISFSPNTYISKLSPFGFDVDGSTSTDENGQATFTITAKKIGKATVTFGAILDDNGDGAADTFYTFIREPLTIKIRK